MLGCAVTNGLISIYGYLLTDLRAPWIPAFLFILLNFLWSTGIGQIPWMLISEVFPYRGRSVASGIAAATAYIEAFVFIKTYYFFHQTFSISGVFAFYGSITLFGTLCIVLFLPETEGRSLAQIESDIENHFNRISKKLRKRKDNEPLKLRL